jgi:hypothetical protein
MVHYLWIAYTLETDIIINDNNFYGDLLSLTNIWGKRNDIGCEVMHRFNTKK